MLCPTPTPSFLKYCKPKPYHLLGFFLAHHTSWTDIPGALQRSWRTRNLLHKKNWTTTLKTKLQDSLLDLVPKAARSQSKDEEDREQGELVPFQHPTKSWKSLCKGTPQTLSIKSCNDQHAWKGCLRKNRESRNGRALPVATATSKVPSNQNQSMTTLIFGRNF